MIATQCPSAETLRQLSAGHLDPPQDDEVLDHLSRCDQCRSDVEAIGDDEDSLIATLRQPGGETPFDGESECKLAIAKALGSLALAGEFYSADAQGSARASAQGSARASAQGSARASAQASTQADPMPMVIGEYEIVRPIGRGGMGRVYLARHNKLGRQVALKVLASHRLADPRMRQRFEAEMRAVGKLSHPNIVTAHDARDVDGTAVLVTEYIDGFDLAQLVARTGPLAIADACEIIRQVSVALSYTSGQGFVHRDVKPSNIMLSRHGEVKLLDLGLARFLHTDESPEMTGTGQTMGTADYVAPEQVTDSRSVDIRADIYSLGCTLFHLLTGSAPFADDAHSTAFAKMTAHVSETPPKLSKRLSGAPAPLVKLVDSMLAKEAARRPSSPLSVAEQLTPYASGADLRRIADRAATVADPTDTRPLPTLATEPILVKPAGLMRRTVPLSFAIATGLLGTLVGLALGIVITITRPDGSKISIDVPDGSDIDIRPSVAAAEPLPDGAAAENDAAIGTGGMMGMDSNGMGAFGMGMDGMGMDGMGMGGESRPTDPVHEMPIAADRPDPLRFAVLHDRESLPDEALEAAKGRLQRSASGGAVMCDVGYWYPVTYGVNVPIEATKGRRRFALAKAGLANEITWEELQSQVGISFDTRVDFAGNRNRGINLTFKDALPNRMRILTGRNLGNHFAVIVNGRVMSAPKIRSELTDAVLLTGSFSASDVLALSEALGMTVDRSEMVPFLYPTADPVSSSMGDPDEAPIRKKLFAIGLGFHRYLDTYRRLPGSKNLTVSDVPHSWRVAILPMIGEAELYSQYRLDESWDSEHNLALLPQMPAIYRSEASESGLATPEGETHLQGFVGPRTGLGDASGVDLAKITDGTSNTLLVIESLASVPWTKPDDIPFNAPEDAGQIKPFPGRPLHFVMADGAVRTMANIDPQNLNLMIIRDDGIPVELD